MKVEILISGFGGQGIMSLGKFLAKAALSEGKQVTYFPSYGAEMRGGTAHCCVKISDSPIASPFEDHPDVALIFNQPSLDKFKKKLKKGGILILNSDFMNSKFSFDNIRGACLPLSKTAFECGNIKVANIVGLGALLSLDPSIFKKETLVKGLKGTFKNQNTLKQNLRALDMGQVLASENKEENKCRE